MANDRLVARLRHYFQPGPGCWEWRGYVMPNGYGVTRGPAQERLAHRVVWEALIGPLPDGLQLDHLCRNKACVNPAHLEPVTQQENTRRHFSAQTHCKNGHEFTPENTYTFALPHRVCRTCRREWSRRARLIRKGASS